MVLSMLLGEGCSGGIYSGGGSWGCSCFVCRAAGPIVRMWGCKREDTITLHRSVLPRWSLKVQGETLGLALCAFRGKGFTRQRSQGWLLQETFPLPLKPGRESSPAAPRPTTGRELPCSPTRGSASHAASPCPT